MSTIQIEELLKESATKLTFDEVLKEIGFVQCANVQLEKILIPTDERKIVSQIAVDKILAKYNLVMGSTSQYIADIPYVNIMAIKHYMTKYPTQQETVVEVGGLYEGYTREDVQNFRPHSWRKNIVVEKGLGASIMGDRGTLLTRNKERNFYICAPQFMFNMFGKKVVDGQIVDLDPIILEQIDSNHYYFVTGWGPEANLKS